MYIYLRNKRPPYRHKHLFICKVDHGDWDKDSDKALRVPVRR